MKRFLKPVLPEDKDDEQCCIAAQEARTNPEHLAILLARRQQWT